MDYPQEILKVLVDALGPAFGRDAFDGYVLRGLIGVVVGAAVVGGGGSEAAAQRVYFNPTQYVEPVSPETWQQAIGGYQPAQKWLKDRQGRPLTLDEARHYQRLLFALAETHRLMAEWDKTYDEA